MPNASPPNGHDWGERTKQTKNHPENAPNAWRTDAEEMRHRFGVGRFDLEDHDYPAISDALYHEWSADKTNSAKGENALVLGSRGCGKSTFLNHLAIRILELNGERLGERVVWRGSPDRSEWLALRDYATVWLPEASHANAEAHWQLEGKGGGRESADLKEVARDVKHYSDPVDLLNSLERSAPGTFNVVYPDPSFSGCEELTERTERIAESLPFVPSWQNREDISTTPLSHWWFAFALAVVSNETGNQWLTWFFDEVGDLLPPNAKENEQKTYSKVTLFRSCMADSRRALLTWFFAGHYRENLHQVMRREFTREVSMPDGSGNPEAGRSSTHPLWVRNSVPMETDIMTRRNVGTALAFTEQSFQLFKWDDIKGRSEDTRRTLFVTLSEPGSESPAQKNSNLEEKKEGVVS